jgi:hypothetical protein
MNPYNMTTNQPGHTDWNTTLKSVILDVKVL